MKIKNNFAIFFFLIQKSLQLSTTKQFLLLCCVIYSSNIDKKIILVCYVTCVGFIRCECGNKFLYTQVMNLPKTDDEISLCHECYKACQNQ